MRSKMRGPAVPAPASSSIYWASVDSSGGSAGSSSGGASSRNYVDPWDLENYAYLRRHSVAAACTPQPIYQSSRLSHHSSAVEPDYWYAPSASAVVREPGYDAPASVEEMYFRPAPRPIGTSGCYYHQQPIYEDEDMALQHLHHYAAPIPLYDHLSELEQVEELRTRELMMRRKHSKVVPSRSDYSREECYYHGRSRNIALYPEEETSVDEVDVPRYRKPSHMGFSAYGHLKIDYTNSWNSLHRKIASK
ncbi:uncharacterized protein LOC106642780 [Copidosoma floridanum]|uniref:uncharacterized protein LOC106642780 n=1 Tax=Copidosoma floridanum TaxID=29053 RepID=UPI0006C9C64D|nr:uncharacterized protein LOC106642780 [Copidosoma floridanum]